MREKFTPVSARVVAFLAAVVTMACRSADAAEQDKGRFRPPSEHPV